MLCVDEPTETASGKTLQNVLVGDKTGVARVTLWESDIHKLVQKRSYQFNKMMVREFRGQMQLSTAKDENSMPEIDDLDEVQQDDDVMLNSCIENATIVGILSFEKFSVCLKCNGKVATADTDSEFGKCSKCGMLQFFNACKEEVAAQMMIKSGSENVLLKGYGKILQQITGEEVTPIGLLRAKPFTAYHQDGIIHSIKQH